VDTTTITKIETTDCTEFPEDYDDIIHDFVTKSDQFERFRFSESQDDLPIAFFDYKETNWRAGRLVGDAQFESNGKEYLLSINPRFGEKHLFWMLEEIFNVRLIESKHTYDRSESRQQLIRKLIAFLWLNLLAKGNRHGLPRIFQSKSYYGNKIRGRINVRKSIIPVKTEQKVVSTYRQKKFDERIIRLLKQAYEILLSDYHLGEIVQPQNAKYALDQLNRIKLPSRRLTDQGFKNIKVKRIYQSFKPVLNLSWDIIKNNRAGNQRESQKQSFSYFIDMAEIWEMYLRSLLEKRLSIEGWSLLEQKVVTYSDKLFKRGLIPDIVFKKGNQVIVLDAKYKRMEFDPNDIDRSDFFQIHTYIQYYQQKYEVIAGGLLYPFSEEFNENRQIQSLSETLFGESSGDTKFFIDGIDLADCGEDDFDFDKKEKKFLDRMVRHIV